MDSKDAEILDLSKQIYEQEKSSCQKAFGRLEKIAAGGEHCAHTRQSLLSLKVYFERVKAREEDIDAFRPQGRIEFFQENRKDL